MGTLKKLKEAVKIYGSDWTFPTYYRSGFYRNSRQKLFLSTNSTQAHNDFAKRYNTQNYGRKSKRNICKTNTAHSKYYPDCQACWWFFSLAETAVLKMALLSDWALKNNEINCPGFLHSRDLHSKKGKCEVVILRIYFCLTWPKCTLFTIYPNRLSAHSQNVIKLKTIDLIKTRTLLVSSILTLYLITILTETKGQF